MHGRERALIGVRTSSAHATRAGCGNSFRSGRRRDSHTTEA
jgi:hypothetical protein